MERGTMDRALQRIPYGLYVLGSADDQILMTIIANWAMQVSFNPPLLVISVEGDSRMREVIENAGYFALNMIPAGKTDMARDFLKPRESSAKGGWGPGITATRNGMPFLQEAIASLECRVVFSHNAGDHLLFVGEVIDAACSGGTGEGVLTLRDTGWRYQR